MAKKIPTQDKLQAKRKQQEKEMREAERKRVMNILYNKVLVFRYHAALAVEAHDLIVPTKDYNKAFKRDGNRVINHLERITDDKFHELYKEHPDYTANMSRKVSRAVTLLSMVDIMEYDNLLEALENFHEAQHKIRLAQQSKEKKREEQK